jgi:hypothetical protein
MEHMAFQRLVMLTVELGDHYRCCGGGSVSLHARVGRYDVVDGAGHGDIFGSGHDKGEMAVETTAKFRRNRDSIGVKFALENATRERVGTTDDGRVTWAERCRRGRVATEGGRTERSDGCNKILS